MRFLLPPFLFLLALLASCASRAQQGLKPSQTISAKQKATPTPAPSADAAPVVVFRKTPCFGTCPHYEASLYADGRVRYEGFNYAPVEGKRELKLPVATINTILAEAHTLHFAELPERYSQGATDLPATSLTISPATGPAKTVTVEDGAPADLQNLLRYVEKQVLEALGVAADK